MRRPARSDVLTGRLRAVDPFELIRWLARSQTDPRKALAELVQNSLDVQARTVTITRVRERGLATLRVLDDGEGVIPELARPEALAYVATHIGHSRKRNLTPEQRRELLLQGQYGIGLLGFWSIGAELEMRSAVAGGEPAALSRGACALPAAGRSCTTISPPRSTAGSPSSHGTPGASAGSSTSPTSPWRRAHAAASSSTRRRTPSRVPSTASSPPPCGRFSPRTSAGGRRLSRRTSCTSSSARFATCRARRRSTTFSPCGEGRRPRGPQRRPAMRWWR